MKRPDLGPWLTDPERLDSWDALVFSKMDRAFRSTAHCVDLARWCEENRKMLVFAEDGLRLDYRSEIDGPKTVDSMLSELFVYLGSFFAQLELNRFKTRARDAQRMLRPTTRWTGKPPLGFKTTEHPSGKGRGLEQDPDEQRVLHEMGRRLLEGESFTGICGYLREEFPDVRAWSTPVVIKALTSPRTQGWKVDKLGDYILGDQGDPILMAPPTFDEDTWAQLQDAVHRRKVTRTRTNSANPVLGIGFCARCGASLAVQITHWKQADGTPRTTERYRCGRTPKGCTNTSVPTVVLGGLLEDHFLQDYGDLGITSKKWEPGNDLAGDLDRVDEQIKRLRSEQDAGLIVSDDDHAEYLRRMKLLVDKRARLEEQEPKRPGWVYVETGETFGEAWESRSPEERRDMLIDRGVRLELTAANPLVVRLVVPDVTQG